MTAQAKHIHLEVGKNLVAVFDADGASTKIANDVQELRQKIADKTGVLMPKVYMQDNVSLDPNSYLIRLHNVVAGRGNTEQDANPVEKIQTHLAEIVHDNMLIIANM